MAAVLATVTCTPVVPAALGLERLLLMSADDVPLTFLACAQGHVREETSILCWQLALAVTFHISLTALVTMMKS